MNINIFGEKNFKYFLVLPLLFILLFGCSESDGIKNSVNIELSISENSLGYFSTKGAGDTLLNNLIESIKSIDVTVEADDITPAIERSIKIDGELSIIVPSGTNRLFTVKLKNKMNKTIFMGYKTVDLKKGETVTVEIPLAFSESFTDPVNDVYPSAVSTDNFYDLKDVSLIWGGEKIFLVFAFNRDIYISKAPDDAGLRGFVEFDADADPKTGSSSFVEGLREKKLGSIGVDYSLFIDSFPNNKMMLIDVVNNKKIMVDSRVYKEYLILDIPTESLNIKPTDTFLMTAAFFNDKFLDLFPNDKSAVANNFLPDIPYNVADISRFYTSSLAEGDPWPRPVIFSGEKTFGVVYYYQNSGGLAAGIIPKGDDKVMTPVPLDSIDTVSVNVRKLKVFAEGNNVAVVCESTVESENFLTKVYLSYDGGFSFDFQGFFDGFGVGNGLWFDNTFYLNLFNPDTHEWKTAKYKYNYASVVDSYSGLRYDEDYIIEGDYSGIFPVTVNDKIENLALVYDGTSYSLDLFNDNVTVPTDSFKLDLINGTNPDSVEIETVESLEDNRLFVVLTVVDQFYVTNKKFIILDIDSNGKLSMDRYVSKPALSIGFVDDMGRLQIFYVEVSLTAQLPELYFQLDDETPVKVSVVAYSNIVPFAITYYKPIYPVLMWLGKVSTTGSFEINLSIGLP